MLIATVNAILDGFIGSYRNPTVLKRLRKELVAFGERGVLVHLQRIQIRDTYLELHFHIKQHHLVVQFPSTYPFHGMKYYVELDYVPDSLEVARAIHGLPTDTGAIIADFLKEPKRICLKKYLYTQHRHSGNHDRAMHLIVNYTEEISPWNWFPGSRFLHQWNTITEWLDEL